MEDFTVLDASEAARALVHTRTFDAPRPIVWKAWTTPESIAVWWGPSGFTNTIHTMDVRVGGVWSFIMHGPDGTDYPNEVRYLVVEEPRKLVYDHGAPGRPDEFRVTVHFTENGDRTDMHYKMVFATAEYKQQALAKYGAGEGLKQNMDRFAAWLKERT